MLKKIMLILLLFSGSTHAYICLNTFTNTTFKGGDQSLVVYIDSDIAKGENIFANVGEYISCRNEIPGQYIDFMDLVDGVAVLPGSATAGIGLSGGVYVNDKKFIAGRPNDRFNVLTLVDGDYHPISIDLYFEVTDAIGPYVEINPGDELMVLKLNSHSIPVESDYNYTWRIIAGNRAILAAGTCEIDRGAPIEVAFGDIGKFKIGTTASQSLGVGINVEKVINFDCENNNLNMDINIHLSADPLSFSSEGFETTTQGLGVVMLHNNNVIEPFGYFPSKIENGIGSEILNFTLIKTANPGPGDLKEGAFTAGGSLIMSIQ